MQQTSNDGSTLIEVIIAMIILAVVVTGLNAAVVSLIKSNLNAKELTSASSTGYQLFEQLRRGTYDDITTGSDFVRNRYVRTWKITTDSTQKKIALTVTWPLASGKHVIELSTIIAKP